MVIMYNMDKTLRRRNCLQHRLRSHKLKSHGSPCITTSYNTPPTFLNLTGSDQFSTVLNRLELIDNTLSQLEDIQKAVKSINSRLDRLDSKVASLQTKISDVEKSREFDSSVVESMKSKQTELDSMLTGIKNLKQQQRQQTETVQKELIDLKARSTRDNLLFFGIPEQRDERDSDCVNKVLTMIEEKCKIEDAKTNIKLHRAHRIGRHHKDKTRPIVAKFAYYPDRERVRHSADQLTRPEGIAQQFPQEVVNTRKRLYPILKKARDSGKEAYLVMD